jgi:hypothetical protein
MLGLGDIVIPGIFISLALRYDFASYVQRTIKRNPDATPSKEDRYSKPYFWTVLVAYIAGLTTTVVVMHTFKAAQPALLYLSPACSQSPGFSFSCNPLLYLHSVGIAVGAVTIVGVVRGEVKQLWRWSGDEEEDAPQNEKPSWATASAMDETPIKPEFVKKQVDQGQQAAGDGAETPLEEDEEWMNLNNTSSEDGVKNRKRKPSKKKK